MFIETLPSRALLILFSVFECFQCLESQDLRRKESGYVLIHPKAIVVGRNESLCLSLHDVALPTRIVVDLKVDNYHEIVTQYIQTEHACLKLFVKPEKVKYSQYGSLHLQIQLNGTIYSSFNTDPIFIVANDKLIFIETDKAIYKPGDAIRFRILILDNSMKPIKDYNVNDIKIINPSGYVVANWQNVPMSLGLLQLEHQLNQNTLLGKWKIAVNNNKLKSFTVKRYVLPRYKVTIDYPRLIHTGCKKLRIKLCARYPYGETVNGSALIKISCPGLLYEPLTRYRPMTNGCAAFVVAEDDLTLKSNFKLNMVAMVTESKTSHVEVVTGKIAITDKPYDFKFATANPYFQPGLPYHGKVLISDRLANVDADEDDVGDTIEICYRVAVKNKWNVKRKPYCRNFTIDSQTHAIAFTLYPFKASVFQVHLQARVVDSRIAKDENVRTFVVNRWYSPSTSYIHINQTRLASSNSNNKCRSAQHLTVYYTSDRVKRNEPVTFYYMIQSKEELIRFGKIVHVPRKQQQQPHILLHALNAIGDPTSDRFTKSTVEIDRFSFKFKLDGNRIVSNVKFLLYFVTKDGEVVSASSSNNAEKCLHHSVKAQWSSAELAPGELATLDIVASPNSICSLSSADTALEFMDNLKWLNAHALLTPYDRDRVPRANYKLCQPHGKRKTAAENLEEFKTIDTYLDLRRRRRSYAMGNTEEYDSSDVFDDFGTSVITNLKLLTKVCQKEQRFNRSFDFVGDDLLYAESLSSPYKTVDYDDSASDDGKTTLRSYFPETWLWELVTTGGDGTAKLDRYTPHTITNWTTNVLCVSASDGPGAAQTVDDLRTFQPFFLDVLLPYAVKRGETFHLETIVFNYLNYSLPVQLIMLESQTFRILDGNDKESASATYCVPGSSSVMHAFRIKPIELGAMNLTIVAEIDTSFPGECGPEYIVNRRDVIYKSVLVEAEGYPSEIVKSAILCTKDSNTSNSVSWNVTFPDGIMRDSLRSRIVLNADLMGPTLHNLDKLINLPTGCGEQIMSTMAPNLYVLKYLTATKQINSKLYGRLVRNLKIGYQKILDYAHDDGSFSAFGYHDRNGSMFLTAFVVRTLSVARSYIYVDGHVIDKAIDWIANNQLENGCFPAVSHVFQYMGGTSLENSTASLTAYVMLSLLESNVNIPEKIVTNAKFCIRANHQPDKYTLAISTYALYLLDWQSEANRSFRKLLDLATKEGELLWWSDSSGSNSLNIEMTGYALMSLLYQNVTNNLMHANAVVRWLSTQRRSFGSFVSTQDTSVALDAIARYAAKTRNKNGGNIDVAITVNGDVNYNVRIESGDTLKSKEIQLTNDIVPDAVYVQATGNKGCVLAQILYNFHVNEIANSEMFKLSLEMEPVSTIDKCSIALVSPCISYVGRGLKSNMAVLDVALPSGYEADTETLYALQQESTVTKLKRFEVEDKRVILYFVELSNEPICVPFTIVEQSIVENRADAIVTLYDYYKPEYRVSTTYRINTCKPNKIRSTLTPSPEDSIAPITDNETQERAGLRNRRTIDSKKNKKEINGLNEDFVDMDVELAVPDGVEGNMPVYVRPETKLYSSNKTAVKFNAL